MLHFQLQKVYTAIHHHPVIRDIGNRNPKFQKHIEKTLNNRVRNTFMTPDSFGTCVMHVPSEVFIIAEAEDRKRDGESAISPKWKIKSRIKVRRTANIVVRVGR